MAIFQSNFEIRRNQKISNWYQTYKIDEKENTITTTDN